MAVNAPSPFSFNSDYDFRKNIYDHGLSPFLKTAISLRQADAGVQNSEIYSKIKQAIAFKKEYYNSSIIKRVIYAVIKIFGGGVIARAELFAKGLENCLGSRVITGQQIGSQGFVDGWTYAFSHNTTTPVEEYSVKYGSVTPRFLEECELPSLLVSLDGLNMDRGGIGRRINGSHIAVLAGGIDDDDAVFSMHAAQGFSEHGLELLESNPRMFHSGDRTEVGKRFFETLVAAPGPALRAQRGIATCIATSTKKLSEDLYEVAGASIGNCAVLHYDREQGTITQLNRPQIIIDGRAIESTGHIEAGVKVHELENTVGFSEIAHRDDLIILATDGLMDNVSSLEMIHTIISQSFFDTVPTVPYNSQALPCDADFPAFSSYYLTPTPTEVVTRLQNYVKWAVRQRTDLETELLQLKMKGGSIFFEHGDEIGERFAEIVNILLSDKRPCGKTGDVTIMAFRPVI